MLGGTDDDNYTATNNVPLYVLYFLVLSFGFYGGGGGKYVFI